MSDSKSLNGSYKHALRVEALNARVAAAELGWRSIAPEVQSGKLRSVRSWLRKRIESADAEIKRLTEEVEALRSGVIPPVPSSSSSTGQSLPSKVPKGGNDTAEMEVEIHEPPSSPVAPASPDRG